MLLLALCVSPVYAATITVPSGGNLQAAFDQAQCGDTIVLQAGATYTFPSAVGSFVLRDLGTCSGTDADYVTITTSNPGGLPAPGTRVNPAVHAAAMPKIVITNGDFRSEGGAHHYKLVGIEITNNGSAFTPVLVSFGTYRSDGAYLTRNERLSARNFVIDRCFIHPAEISASNLATSGLYRTAGKGVVMNVLDSEVVNSYIAGFTGFYPGTTENIDSMGVLSEVGGNLRIANNYIEANFSNVFVGGADPDTPNKATLSGATMSQATFSSTSGLTVGTLVALRRAGIWQVAKVTGVTGTTVTFTPYGPSGLASAPDVPGGARWNGDLPQNITIQGNTLVKRSEWATSFGQPKNWIEIKSAINLTIDGNRMTSGWPTNLALTVRNQNGSAPWARLHNIQVSNNYMTNWNSFAGVLTEDNEHSSSVSSSFRFLNNLLVSTSTSDSFNFLFGIAGGYGSVNADSILIQHNTIINPNKTNIIYGSSGPITNVVYKDNITYSGLYGLNCWNGARTVCWPGLIDTTNVFINNSGQADAEWQVSYPNDFIAPNVSSVGFVDIGAGNYRLSPGSAYAGRGSDGTDPGVNMDTLEAALGGQTPPPLPPTPAACGDGVDNDGDKLIDTADPGCINATDTDESNEPIPPITDTTAPDVSVRAIRSGGSSNYTVTATTTATDVARVEFFVDGVLRSMLTVSPYVAKVSISVRGNHVVRVDMRDRAGNVGTASQTVVR